MCWGQRKFPLSLLHRCHQPRFQASWQWRRFLLILRPKSLRSDRKHRRGEISDCTDLDSSFSFSWYRCKKSLFARFMILMHKRVLCHNLDRAASGTRYTIPIQNVCLDKENLHLRDHKPYHGSPNKRKIAHKRMKNFIWYNSRSFHSLSHSSSYVKQTGNYLTLRGSLAYDSIAYHRQGHNWKSCHTMAVVPLQLPWFAMMKGGLTEYFLLTT